MDTVCPGRINPTHDLPCHLIDNTPADGINGPRQQINPSTRPGRERAEREIAGARPIAQKTHLLPDQANHLEIGAVVVAAPAFRTDDATFPRPPA